MKNSLLFILILCLASSAFAQTPKPSTAPTPPPARKCEVQLARLLIDQLASDSKSIE